MPATNYVRIVLISAVITWLIVTAYLMRWASPCHTIDRIGAVNCTGTTGWGEF